MSISNRLNDRCQGTCELCNALPATIDFTVSPKGDDVIENQVAICETCSAEMHTMSDREYWRCLEGSIWNIEPSVQALSYRLLHRIRETDWAAAILESVDLDENVVQWAMQAFEVADVHQDSFGNPLENGDNVVLTQALNVKGTSFSAAKGTVVKRIRLVPGNTDQIEGKINDQTIVILTKYVKKN